LCVAVSDSQRTIANPPGASDASDVPDSDDDEDNGEDDDEDDDSDEADDSDGDDRWVDVADNYIGNNIPFTGSQSFNMPDEPHDNPSEIFKLFLTDDIIGLIVAETNIFANDFINGPASTPAIRNKYRTWTAVDDDEICKFLGVLFVMGIVKKPRISDYWEVDPVTVTPFIRTVMSRRRFQRILKFIHFDSAGPAHDGDRIFKLRVIQQMIIARFQQVYTPGREVSIDEAMMLWRDRLMFRQYIPGKRHKYGVKMFMLCEPNGYVYNFNLYTGKSEPMPGFGLAETAVLRLIEPLLDEGRELYIDNYYTSYPLAQELLRRRTTMVGTLRTNR